MVDRTTDFSNTAFQMAYGTFRTACGSNRLRPRQGVPFQHCSKTRHYLAAVSMNGHDVDISYEKVQVESIFGDSKRNASKITAFEATEKQSKEG